MVDDVDEGLLLRKAGLFDDRFQHPQIRLMRDQQVDIVHRQIVGFHRLEEHFGHSQHTVFEDGPTIHAEMDAAAIDIVFDDVVLAAQSAARSGCVQRFGSAPVGMQDR